MANGVAPLGRHPNAPIVGAVTAVALHALVGLAVTRMPMGGLAAQRNQAVEVDLVQPKAPDPPALVPDPPKPDPPPPPEAVLPKRIHRPTAHKVPPMPNQESKPPTPSDPPPAPVFGVTQDSVVTGESTVAVPVGNTLMTKERTLSKVAPPPLPAAPPPPAFAPVDEESVAELPERVSVPEPTYPEMARRLGVEGKVRLRLGIDRRGNVKSVRVLQKVGYGMDEAAEVAAWHSRWKPARQENGQPVDVVIHYDFTFRMPTR